MTDNIFTTNLSALAVRFAKLAACVRMVEHDRVQVGQSADGSVFYAVRSASGEHQALTNAHDPLRVAQANLRGMQHRLGNGLSPAVIIGLAPGIELDFVFEQFRSRLQHNEPMRRIYVVINSTPCLIGWLKAADRRELLAAPEVEFHWHSDVSALVSAVKRDWQRSHLFIPLSSLPPGEVNQLIEPLAELYRQRQTQQERWHAANQSYYDQLDDAALGKIISGDGGRKPRLLMPTHGSSSVVQYSTRDTCAAFEAMGWETQILKAERELTPWIMVKTIREFRPDAVIFINHLRTEHSQWQEIYPDDLLFITWIQDAVPEINSSKAAAFWNALAQQANPRTGRDRKRDLIIGYINHAKRHGYLADRLQAMPMIVNTNIFRPRELTAAQQAKYGCDVMFASNRGRPTEVALREVNLPALAPLGFSEELLQAIHAHLWEQYRAERTFTSYDQLLAELSKVPGFAAIYPGLDNDQQTKATDHLFWFLNDTIYRHVVLEWLDEYAQHHPDFKLHLYGKGWDQHPRFAKYHQGVLAHGEELSIAFQAASQCLHLNSGEGTHQRLLEIIASGGNPLTRHSNPARRLDPCCATAFRKLATPAAAPINPTPSELAALLDWLYPQALTLLRATPSLSAAAFANELRQHLQTHLNSDVPWLYRAWHEHTFATCTEFHARLHAATPATVPDSEPRELLNAIAGLRTSLATVTAVAKLLDTPRPTAELVRELPATTELFAYAQLAAQPQPPLAALQHAFTQLPQRGPGLVLAQVDQLLRAGQTATATTLFDQLDSADLRPPLRLGYAVAQARLGRLAAAEVNLERAYAADPAVQDGHARIAWNVFWPKKDYIAAIAELTRDHDCGRLSPEGRIKLAIAHAAAGDTAKASEQVEIAYTADPTLKDGHARIAWNVCWPNKDYAATIAELTRDADAGRLSPEARLNLAVAYAAAGATAKASEQVEIAYAADPAVQDGHARIAWNVFWPKKDYAATIAWLTRDADAGRLSPEARLNLAVAHAAAGELDAAAQHVAAVYAADPNAKDGYARIAWRLYWPARKYSAAICEFKKDLELGRLSEAMNANMARAAIAIGESEEGFRLLSSVGDGLAQRGWPQYAFVAWDSHLPRNNYVDLLQWLMVDQHTGRLNGRWQCNLAVAHVLNDQYEEGERIVQQAYSRLPSANAYRGTIAEMVFLPQLKFDEARKLYEKDFQEGRLLPARWPAFAKCLAAVGSMEEANALLSQWCKAMPDGKDGYSQAGIGAWHCGLFAEALNLFAHDETGRRLTKFQHLNYARAALNADDFELTFRLIEKYKLGAGDIVLPRINWFEKGIARKPDWEGLRELLQLDYKQKNATGRTLSASIWLGFIAADQELIDRALASTDRLKAGDEAIRVKALFLMLSHLHDRAHRVDEIAQSINIAEVENPFCKYAAAYWLGLSGRADECQKGLSLLYSEQPMFFLGKDARVFDGIFWLSLLLKHAGNVRDAEKCREFARKHAPSWQNLHPALNRLFEKAACDFPLDFRFPLPWPDNG